MLTPEPDEQSSGSVDEVRIALEINIAGEKVQFQVNLPAGPASWEHMLPFMRALVKVGSDISQEYFTDRGQTVSCRAGCGICCRQQVPIAEFEAHRLRRLVESMPEPRRSTILERFRQAEQRVREAGLEDLVSADSQTDLKELTRRSTRYFRLMIPCPFLENESCSIYEERPLKCREYLVTSPAENCANPDQPGVVPLPLPLSVYLTTLLLKEEATSSDLHWVPLYKLISWTDSHEPEPPEKTGPELLHRFMSVLVQPKG